MRRSLSIRSLTTEEQARLRCGLRSGNAFVLRRCQILLASARGDSVEQIHTSLGFSRQGVRDVLHAFDDEGLMALTRRSNRPKSGPKAHPTLAEAEREQLRQILEQSPRVFGKPASVWTLTLLAQVVQEQGLSVQILSLETIRVALKRLGLNWKRAKNRINSPDLSYTRKKTDGID
jgi:transposase